MTPFITKPGETVVGLGIDFRSRLAVGETIAAVPTVTSDTAGIIISNQGYSGTVATAAIAIPANQADASVILTYVVTGSAGSVRKASRVVWVRAASE